MFTVYLLYIQNLNMKKITNFKKKTTIIWQKASYINELRQAVHLSVSQMICERKLQKGVSTVQHSVWFPTHACYGLWINKRSSVYCGNCIYNWHTKLAVTFTQLSGRESESINSNLKHFKLSTQSIDQHSFFEGYIYIYMFIYYILKWAMKSGRQWNANKVSLKWQISIYK